MISINDLSQFDDFEWKEEDYALVGRNTGLRFGMGDKVKVRVAATNLEKRQIDYAILELPEQKQEKRRPAHTEKPKHGAARKGAKRKK
jgi:ribonuclease R